MPPSSRRRRLSNRYITDRHLPDKAIDLIDEAAARLRTEIDSKPQALDEVDRQIMQLEIEREALKKEKDKASQGTASKTGAGDRRICAKSPALSRPAGRPKNRPSANCARLKEKMEQTRLEMERAEREHRPGEGCPPALWRPARAEEQIQASRETR